MTTHILLLHGLGSHTLTLKPLELFLKFKSKYKNIYNIKYDLEFEHYLDALDELRNKINNIFDISNDKLIIIGQSMGGVMAHLLHTKGWNVIKSISIGSPIHGANIVNYLEYYLPKCIKRKCFRKSYNYLKKCESIKKPPHPYHTISMSWFYSNFDGCVFTNEAKFDNNNHTHLNFADHRTIFMNPRLWYLVHKLLN